MQVLRKQANLSAIRFPFPLNWRGAMYLVIRELFFGSGPARIF
jgi:hypothetical protein